ncbi:crAss001_48 related protein [Burkholderia sp. DN3021]|uniref:crAss001_48 related protein n=1 Tax=Burkholderia sp. DN3021 TaxID=3410137 RepID=UPI003C7D28D8
MQAHQQRVVEEKAELDERIERLQQFTLSLTFRDLDYIDQELLRHQQHLMEGLSAVLGTRIQRFTA